ncbi:MAG: PIG-L family deacetylase [Pseudomonadota bacterium]
MAIVHILAHFDDEYFATPLIRRIVDMEAEQRFLYLADYASPALAARRMAETRAYLADLGVPPEQVIHVGRGSGALDGELYRHLPQLRELLAAELSRIGEVDRLIVTAWEGGHMDHDACAALAVRLSDGAPVEQFSLYNGPRLPGSLFRAGAPLAENGPRIRVRLSLPEWLAFAAGVRRFPSQARTWLGLWPVMFANYLGRGFGYQSLRVSRVTERPHAGPLLYERMYGVPYAEVAEAIRTVWPAGSPESPPA